MKRRLSHFQVARQPYERDSSLQSRRGACRLPSASGAGRTGWGGVRRGGAAEPVAGRCCQASAGEPLASPGLRARGPAADTAPRLLWTYLRFTGLRPAESLQLMGFAPGFAGTTCGAPTDMRVENVSEVKAIASRHKVYKLRAFRVGLEGGGWCGQGVVVGAWELLVTSSEVLKGLVLYGTGIP